MASEQVDSQAQEPASLSEYQRAILQGLGISQYVLKAQSALATTEDVVEVDVEAKAHADAEANVKPPIQAATQVSSAAAQPVPSQLTQTLRDDIELAMGQSNLTFVHAEDVSFSDTTVATPATLSPAAKKQLWQHFCQQQ